jgi:hypothetical protein
MKLPNIFIVQRTQVTFFPTFIIGRKHEFQSEVNYNKVVVFSHPSSRTPWNLRISMDLSRHQFKTAGLVCYEIKLSTRDASSQAGIEAGTKTTSESANKLRHYVSQ